MRRSVLFAVLAAVLVSATLQQSPLGTISDKFRRTAPPAYGALGEYVTGLRTFAFVQEASFPRSQIDQYLHTSRTFSIGQGTGRLLRFRRTFRRASPARVFRPVVRRVHVVHRPVVRHVRVAHRPVLRFPIVVRGRFVPQRRVVVAAPVCPFGGASIAFKPWNGIAALKFGTSYSNVALDSALHFPGTTWVKASGIVAVRQGDTIHTKVGFGWTVGSGRQLHTKTKVRKCKRRFFRKKCWDEWITIPRGVNANELHSVSDGMNHLLFNKIADVAGGRLLRMRYRPNRHNQQPEFEANKHVVTGVHKKHIIPALEAMNGKKINFRLQDLLSGKELSFDGKSVQATQENGSNSFTLVVKTQ